LDKTFPVTVSNGQVDIGFINGAADAPLVNAIEIISGAPAPAPAPPPASGVRINSGGSAYTDASGTTWSADTSFTGGQTFAVSRSIANTSTPALYQNCRWGAFTYSIPVSSGKYTVKLKFAEISMTGPDQRMFNVTINGTLVLLNLDVYAEADGAFRAVDKSFAVTVTNGRVDIAFTYGSVDAPFVNAIEVVAAP
jgi:hypothetical protein